MLLALIQAVRVDRGFGESVGYRAASKRQGLRLIKGRCGGEMPGCCWVVMLGAACLRYAQWGERKLKK